MNRKIWINEGKKNCAHEWEIEEGTYCCTREGCDAEYVDPVEAAVHKALHSPESSKKAKTARGSALGRP